MKPPHKAFFLAEYTGHSTRYMADFELKKEDDTKLYLRNSAGTIGSLVETIHEDLLTLIRDSEQKRIIVSELEGRIKMANIDGFSTLRPLTQKETAHLRREFIKAKVKSYLNRK